MHEPKPDCAETLDLLQRVQAGDPEAFAKLFARHQPELRRFVDLRLDAQLRARVDPSDILQETQMEVCRRLADFLKRQPMPFHLWLRKTAYERLLMLRRQHLETGRRTVARDVPLPDRSSLMLAQQLVAAGSTPSERLHRRDLVQRVQAALAQLSEGDREILVMRNYEGLSYQEAAYLLEIDVAAAHKRHGRALVRLHLLLSDGGLTEAHL